MQWLLVYAAVLALRSEKFAKADWPLTNSDREWAQAGKADKAAATRLLRGWVDTAAMGANSKKEGG